MKKRLMFRGRQEGQWEVLFPVMPGPIPLLAGTGATKQAALEDLLEKATNDPLAQVWLDMIDWTVPQYE